MTTSNNAAATTTEMPPKLFDEQSPSAPDDAGAVGAATIGIADFIKRRESVAELGRRDRNDEQRLPDLALFGEHRDFRRNRAESFFRIRLFRPLRSRYSGLVRNGAIFMGEAGTGTCGAICFTARKPAIRRGAARTGAEVFDYFPRTRNKPKFFNGAMTDMSVATAPAVVEAYDFRASKRSPTSPAGTATCWRRF
jgi:hypothetical protein